MMPAHKFSKKAEVLVHEIQKPGPYNQDADAILGQKEFYSPLKEISKYHSNKYTRACTIRAIGLTPFYPGEISFGKSRLNFLIKLKKTEKEKTMKLDIFWSILKIFTQFVNESHTNEIFEYQPKKIYEEALKLGKELSYSNCIEIFRDKLYPIIYTGAKN